MIKVTEEIDKLWNEETYKVYQGEPMLSWEACEMIAWNRISKKLNNEDLNRQVPEEG